MRDALCIPDECLSVSSDWAARIVIKTKALDRSRHAATIGKRRIRDTTAEKLERITKDRPSWRDWRDGFNGPVRAGPGNPDPALRAADLVSAARRTDFYSSLRLLSGSLHFFPHRAAPLSAQFGRSKTFAVAPKPLYRRFGNSLSKYLRCRCRDSVIVAFVTAFLFNGTGSIR